MTGTNANGGTSGFSPEMVATINRAYEDATARLSIQAAHSDRRAILAKCIMELAQNGENDEHQLRDKAMAAVKRADLIRQRAHRLWEEEGRPSGRSDEHWRRAEADLGGSAE